MHAWILAHTADIVHTDGMHPAWQPATRVQQCLPSTQLKLIGCSVSTSGEMCYSSIMPLATCARCTHIEIHAHRRCDRQKMSSVPTNQAITGDMGTKDVFKCKPLKFALVEPYQAHQHLPYRLLPAKSIKSCIADAKKEVSPVTDFRETARKLFCHHPSMSPR